MAKFSWLWFLQNVNHIGGSILNLNSHLHLKQIKKLNASKIIGILHFLNKRIKVALGYLSD